MANTAHNTAMAHESAYDEQGRRFGHHTANRMQQARRLREQIADFNEDIASLRSGLVERAERYGWNDAAVLRGDAVCCQLERERDALRQQMKQLELGVA